MIPAKIERVPSLVAEASPAREQHRQRREEHAEGDQLDLPRLDLLAQVLGGAADHQAADEDREQDVEQHRVEARADAAEDHLAEAEVGERHRPAEPRQGLEGRVDGAAGGDRGHRGPQRGAGDPEALLLALHVAAGRAGDGVGVQAGGVLGDGAVLLGHVDDRDPPDEEDEHRGEDRPTLPSTADHAAVGVGQRRWE